MADNTDSVTNLFANSSDIAVSTAEILLKIATNIVNNPDSAKYRSLKVSNAVVSNKLLPVSGAMECLFEMGFEEGSECLTLPPGASALRRVQRVKQRLEAEVQRVRGGGAPAGGAVRAQGGAAAAAAAPHSAQAQGSGGAEALLGAVGGQALPTEAQQTEFYRKLTAGVDCAARYEDATLQAQARAAMPVAEMEKRALEKLDQIKAESSSAEVDKQDLLLLEMLAWFKNRFFRWVDCPECERCGAKTERDGSGEPTPAELQFGGARVELYRCTVCAAITRFPRFNHPGKLLETRRGRCGEWANCFTLCCRAVGMDARYVLDWTDHVWTEVYSLTQRRWFHCDSCENKCDKPLIYEAGWGKKLTYIIAFSKDDIQDVTWRYSAHHADVLARRRECGETWLVDALWRLRKTLQAGLREERRRELAERTVRELVELMSPRTAGQGEDTGRESGSLAWRLARGETGGVAAKRVAPTIIKPTQAEIQQRCVHLKYSCSTDEYVRVSDEARVTRGWDHMTSEVSAVMRKEEHDWRMTYLAREEGAAEAHVSWKFDFTDSGLVIDSIDVTAQCARYENGQVMWRMCGDDSCSFLPPDGAFTRIRDVSGSSTVTLTAHMRGGKGSVAWQHTQLFRQTLDEREVYPLDIKIALRKP